MKVILTTILLVTTTAGLARTIDKSKGFFWKIKPSKLKDQYVLNELGNQSTPLVTFNVHQDASSNRIDCEKMEQIMMKATGKTYQCTQGQAFVEKNGGR